jgi:hypothetical protein
LHWRAAASSPLAQKYITISVNQVDPLDYLGVAVHNFGTAGIAVSAEGATGLVGSPPAPEWFELTPPALLANDEPLILRWAPQSLVALRLRMQPGSQPPRAAVVYAGKLLVSPRGTHQDYVPINLARNTDTPIGVSENGHFLGSVTVSEGRASTFALKLLPPAWYRQNMDSFVQGARRRPFFFAWKPQEFPRDCGYCILASDVQPQRAFDTGTMAVELPMRGVAV